MRHILYTYIGKENNITMNNWKEANKSVNSEKCIPGELLEDTASISSAVVHSLFKINETKKQKRNEKCYYFIKQNKAIMLWMERVFLISICTAIAGGFTMPIIIYAINANQGDDSRLSSALDLESCSNITSQVSVLINRNLQKLQLFS